MTDIGDFRFEQEGWHMNKKSVRGLLALVLVMSLLAAQCPSVAAPGTEATKPTEKPASGGEGSGPTMDAACWCCHKLFAFSAGWGLNRNATGLCPECKPRITSCVKETAAKAAKKYYWDCDGSVLETAKGLGIEIPLSPKTSRANDLIEWMEENWEPVDGAEEAQRQADNGELVVAGLAVPDGTGHVAVVVAGPGEECDGKTWPNVAGGAAGTEQAVEVSGRPYSEGGNSMCDAWRESQRAQVKFYKPRDAHPTKCCEKK